MCLVSSTVLEASRILASAGAEAFRTAGEADRGGRAFNVHYDGEEGAPVFYAILVAAHLYFSRCASERERSERERCASSRVPFAISRFFTIFAFFSRFSRFFARARSRIAHREKYRCAK